MKDAEHFTKRKAPMSRPATRTLSLFAPALTWPNPRKALRRWAELRALAHQRRALANLDDAMLRDIGLTAAAARAEAERPFWDAPHHWR